MSRPEKLTFVMLSTHGCGNCRKLLPVLAKYAEDTDSKLQVWEYGKDEEADYLVNKYDFIQMFPTVLMYDFDSGLPINSFCGNRSYSWIKDWVENELESLERDREWDNKIEYLNEKDYELEEGGEEEDDADEERDCES